VLLSKVERESWAEPATETADRLVSAGGNGLGSSAVVPSSKVSTYPAGSQAFTKLCQDAQELSSCREAAEAGRPKGELKGVSPAFCLTCAQSQKWGQPEQRQPVQVLVVGVSM